MILRRNVRKEEDVELQPVIRVISDPSKRLVARFLIVVSRFLRRVRRTVDQGDHLDGAARFFRGPERLKGVHEARFIERGDRDDDRKIRIRVFVNPFFGPHGQIYLPFS